MMCKASWIFAMFGVGLVACITPFSPSGVDAQGGTLVIEGDIILNGYTKVYVSESMALEGNESIRYLSNAQVSVESDMGDVYTAEVLVYSAGTGQAPYYAIDTRDLPSDRRYYLSVSLPDGSTFFSEPQAPLVTPEIDTITFAVNEEKRAVDFLVTTYSDNRTSSYYRWEFTEDWEVNVHYRPGWYYDPQGNRFVQYPNDRSTIYYCWNRSESTAILVGKTEQLENNTVYRHKVHTIEQTSDKISVLYAIEVQQMSISKEAYRYWETLRKNRDEIGGIFAPQPSEQYGNIHTVRTDNNANVKVLGFINVGTVTAKRMFVSEEEMGIYVPEFRCAGAVEDDKPIESPIIMHNMGYRVAEYSIDDFGVHITWAPVICVDCTVRGTKNKPSFWPNDHL